VGAGPFVVSEWIRGDRLVLKRNPDYFEPGKPYLDELILRDVVDAPTRLQSVQSGDADLAMNVNPDLGRQAREVGLSTAEQVNGTQVMQMNTRRAPFETSGPGGR
jgi:peptide/nickel transport system substrate-binding protein